MKSIPTNKNTTTKTRGTVGGLRFDSRMRLLIGKADAQDKGFLQVLKTIALSAISWRPFVGSGETEAATH
jgi:hypothetical protein